MPKQIITLMGVPDGDRIVVQENSGSLSEIKTYIGGNNSLNEFIDSSGLSMQSALLGGRSPENIKLENRPDLIVNTICDADSNSKSLALAEQMEEVHRVQMINAPSCVKLTRRESVFHLLSGIEGIHVPKTIRITPRGVRDIVKLINDKVFSLPIIVREAGAHGGQKMLLIENDAMFAQLHQFAFDGRDYYVSEFIDYRSQDSLYRKTRFILVDGVCYPRHLIIAKGWKIHAASRKELMNEDNRYAQEEEQFLSNIPASVVALAQKVHEKIPLDFVGIDCHIDERGELLIFEVNACFRVFVPGENSKHQAVIDNIVNAVNNMIRKRVSDV